MTVQGDMLRWSMTRKLLRQGKRSEYLSRPVTSEEQFTRFMIGALLEFGKSIAENPAEVSDCLIEFLESRGVESNLAPNFQWEGECLKLMEVGIES